MEKEHVSPSGAAARPGVAGPGGWIACAGLLFFLLWGAQVRPFAGPSRCMDVAEVVSRPDRFQDEIVRLKGIVTSVCNEEGCFIDLVSMSGEGEGVLVSGRGGKIKFPRDCVGKAAVVRGTFYRKVYPFSRMAHWKHHGWRPGEGPPPRFAVIHRLEADEYELLEPEKAVAVREAPLVPWKEGPIDLDRLEFEAARTGVGKKVLPPGGRMPRHSTGRYHEFLYVVEGRVTVIEGEGKVFRVPRGRACYIPPGTEHEVRNESGERAGYLFFYALPAGGAEKGE